MIVNAVDAVLIPCEVALSVKVPTRFSDRLLKTALPDVSVTAESVPTSRPAAEMLIVTGMPDTGLLLASRTASVTGPRLLPAVVSDGCDVNVRLVPRRATMLNALERTLGRPVADAVSV